MPHPTPSFASKPILLALVVGLHWPGGHVRAQTPEREPAVVELPASTRAMGLGTAYQVGAPDADVVFYNPALLGRADGLMAGYHRLGDESLALTLATVHSALGGQIGIGLQVLEGETPGIGLRGGGVDPLLRPQPAGVGELVGSLAYGTRLFGVRVGATAKLIDQRFDDVRDLEAAFDVGLAHDLGPVTASLAVQNLGPDRTIAARKGIDQPLRVTFGVGGYGQQVGPLDVGVAAAVSRRDDGEVVGGGGVEIGYWPVVGRTFVVRVGARNVPDGEALPVTFGGSVWLDDLVLEYAFQHVDDAEGVHRVSLGWR